MKSEPRYSQLHYQERQAIAVSLEQGLSMQAYRPDAQPQRRYDQL